MITRKTVFFIFFVLSLFLYFSKFSNLLTFDADQEYYAYKYIEIVKEHKLTLLGIETSAGGMFVGPLYTYLSTLIYWLFQGNPIGIYIATLLFASTQAGLTYILFSRVKGQRIGLIAGFLVLFSATLWNKAFSPSVIPLIYPFSLVFLYAMIESQHDMQYFNWLFILLGSAIHLHISLLSFFPILLIFLFWKRPRKFKNPINWLKGLGFIIFFSLPLLLFEARHNFIIFQNARSFLNKTIYPQDSGNFSIINHVIDVLKSLVEMLKYILTPNPGILVFILLMAVGIYSVFKFKKDKTVQIAVLLFVPALILFILYRGPQPDYYFYFLLPAFFLLLAIFIDRMNRSIITAIPVFLLLILLLFQNLSFIYHTFNPYHLFLKWNVAKYIKSEAQEKNIKLLYDTDLGLGFGFNYLLDYEEVRRKENDFDEVYQIIIRRIKADKSKEFRVPGSPVTVQVRKID